MRTVELDEGARERIRFEVPPPPPAPPPDGSPPVSGDDGETSPLLVPAIIAFTGGGIALVVGTVAGVAALGKLNELESTCPSKRCVPEDEDIADEANTLATVSTIGFVLGGLGVAAGVTLVVIDNLDDEEEDRVALRASPGSIWLEGSF
jgi:hypothetical protein